MALSASRGDESGKRTPRRLRKGKPSS
jgi:hypothetical protein